MPLSSNAGGAAELRCCCGTAVKSVVARLSSLFISGLMALSLTLTLTSCGSTDSATLVDASVGGPDAALDLDRARWIHAPVYADSSTSISSSDLTISVSGELISAWSEDIGSGTIETATFVGEGGPEFTTASRLAIPGANVSRPSIFAGANAVHVVGSGRAGATNSDILYARRTNGTWSAQVNLTGPGDTLALSDLDGEVLESGAETVVLYRSEVFSQSIEPSGVYMLRFTDPQVPGAAQTVLDRAVYDCDRFEALADSAGAIHIVADCVVGDVNSIYYVTNKAGTFVTTPISAPDTTSPFTPDIALSDGGDTVHLLWVAFTDCGGLPCRDVFYSRDLGPPVSVTGGEEDGGFFPNLAVDSLGRVIVVFHRLGNVDDVMWTYSDSGSSFARVQLATPGTPDSIDSTVGNLVINPTTGRPHMVYSHSLPGVGGSNVFHAELIR